MRHWLGPRKFLRLWPARLWATVLLFLLSLQLLRLTLDWLLLLPELAFLSLLLALL